MKRFIKAFRTAKRDKHILVYSPYAQDYYIISHQKFMQPEEQIIKIF